MIVTGFEAKVRKVGNSKAILLPREMAREMKVGQTIRVVVYPDQKRKLKALKETFGMMRGAGPFVRDYEDRY